MLVVGTCERFGKSSWRSWGVTTTGRVVGFGASGCKGRFVSGGGGFDGGVPLVEEEDCCNVLGCSGRLVVDDDREGRFEGGVIPVFARGDCGTLFRGAPTIDWICTGSNTF